jgi:hypothetical protein
MAMTHEPTRDVGAHASEPHDADLHGSFLAVHLNGHRYTLRSFRDQRGRERSLGERP